jgi:hypothetical protein
MREQVEYQEIRNQFAVEMAKQGKTNAETEMAWEKAWGQITERMTAAYMEARDAFEAYDTLKTPLPENAIFQGLREMWDKGSRENAIKEAADRLIKVHAYQLMESLGLPVDSMRARNLRRAVGMTWQSQPAAGTVGNVMYAGASEWNRLVLGKNLPMFPAYFARAIANGVNYYGRFLPIPGTWFTGNIDPEGKGTDWSNETETDRRENFNRKWIIGPVFGGLVALWIYTHKAKVNSHYPTDKKEREKFITEGHKVNTIEFLNDDGSFIPFSLNIGPFAPLAVYAVAAQAVMDQNDKYAKEQAKADAVAKAHGLQPSPIPHDWAMDDLEVAGKAGYQALLGSATAVGLTSGFNEFGIPNAKKAIASVLSPLVPGLPNYQSVSRMMGVALDSHIATVFDFMVPLPTSGARMLNALGDPVKTPNDIQRIVQELTGGSYPFPVDPKSVADGQQAYANMLSTGYQPPPVSPARGFNINGEYRPMNTAELEAYTAKRGELFKANLAALGANPSKDQVKSAFQEANQQALSSVGAAPAAPQRVSGVSGQRRGAVGGRAQAQRMGRATVGGRGTIRGSLKMSGRRVNLRGTRASMRSTGKIHAAKMPRLSSGSSLRMKRRVRL